MDYRLCVNGHPVAERLGSCPSCLMAFAACGSCGEALWAVEDYDLSARSFRVFSPFVCKQCQQPFPWTEAARIARRQQHAGEILTQMFKQFHSALLHFKRVTGCEVRTESDVASYLELLLQCSFKEVQTEEGVSRFLGKSSRIDFLLSRERIVLSLKVTRQTRKPGEIEDEILGEAVRYSKHPACDILIVFVYDPEHLVNRDSLQRDIEQAARLAPHQRLVIAIEPH